RRRVVLLPLDGTEQRGHRQRGPRQVRLTPQAAGGGAGGLVLPLDADLGPSHVEVVDEQRGEQGGGRLRLEDLDAERPGALVGAGEDLVLGHRVGVGGRGDGDRHGVAVGEGSGGAPALDPLGQRVVGALLWDQGVVDRRAAALLVVAVEDLLAGECADDLLDVGRFASGQRRVGGLPHVGGDDEGVHGGGDVGERIGGAVGQEVDDEGVGRRRQPDVGATVRVEVAAHRERGGGGGPGPRGDLGEL